MEQENQDTSKLSALWSLQGRALWGMHLPWQQYNAERNIVDAHDRILYLEVEEKVLP